MKVLKVLKVSKNFKVLINPEIQKKTTKKEEKTQGVFPPLSLFFLFCFLCTFTLEFPPSLLIKKQRKKNTKKRGGEKKNFFFLFFVVF